MIQLLIVNVDFDEQEQIIDHFLINQIVFHKHNPLRIQLLILLYNRSFFITENSYAAYVLLPELGPTEYINYFCHFSVNSKVSKLLVDFAKFLLNSAVICSILKV